MGAAKQNSLSSLHSHKSRRHFRRYHRHIAARLVVFQPQCKMPHMPAARFSQCHMGKPADLQEPEPQIPGNQPPVPGDDGGPIPPGAVIRPIADAVAYHDAVQMKRLQSEAAKAEAQRRLEEYDRKHGKCENQGNND